MAENEPREQIQLSLAQVAASCAAAVSAAVICSFFGVAGTVIGTAAASLVATIGSAVYSYSLRRTKTRLRRLHQAGAVSPPVGEVVKTFRQQGRQIWSQLPLRVLGIGAAMVFVVSIAVVTAVELGLGKSLAAAFGVSHSGAHETALGSVVSPSHHSSTPSGTPSPQSTTTSTPSSRATAPKPTATATVTRTATTSATPSPTSTPTPSSTLSVRIPTASPSR